MTNDMAAPADLAELPGAPFTDAIVDAAVSDLRSRLGWHVAPERTETLELDHDGGRDLILPTRQIVSITEIRDVSGDTPVVLTGWRVSKRKGIMTGYSWPCGTAVLEVDLVHGYAEAPPDLLSAVAALCGYVKSDPHVESVQIDDFQTSFRRNMVAVGADSAVMATYGLPRDF